MSNDYWTGATLAHLDASQISAPWGRGEYCSTRIGFANELFQFWYDSRRNIAACRDQSHKSAMTQQLVDAGRAGYGVVPVQVLGWGIDDLEEAFQHIHDNSGRWTHDTNSLTYFGGATKVFRRGGLINNMPKPFVEFANSVDEKFQIVRSAMNNMDRQSQQLRQQLRSSRTDWNRVASCLTEIKNWGTRAKPFLWSRPRVQQVVGRTTTFVDALGNIHSGLTTYEAARRTRFSRGEAAAIGALRTAVGFVPVLGAYYGGMVDLIPTLHAWFSDVIAQRVREIDSYLTVRH